MMLYLHGFRSSPESFKARLLADELQRLNRSNQWRCPQLPVSPAQALELARGQAQDLAQSQKAEPREITIVGSSLGGFYAIVLAEELGCRAVLINPAVHAPRALATQVGDHLTYHGGEPMTFAPAYVDELATMSVPKITRPERYLLLAATGDELLDYRDMLAFLPAANHIVIPGSDHGLSDFAQYMPQVLHFAGMAEPNSEGH